MPLYSKSRACNLAEWTERANFDKDSDLCTASRGGAMRAKDATLL